MTTRKQPMVTLRLSRFVILCLALVAAGAVAHDWLAGRAMWEFYRAEAAVLVAEAEEAFREQAAYSTKHSARVHRQMADGFDKDVFFFVENRIMAFGEDVEHA